MRLSTPARTSERGLHAVPAPEPGLPAARASEPGLSTAPGLRFAPSRLRPDRRAARRARVKRLVDLAGASSVLLVCLPILALIALAIRLGGGPVVFGHERVGRGGRGFRCLKFRTMVPDAEARLAALLQADPAARAEWEATRKLRRDPRVTRIGRLLRASSLDELPQLLNVLRGEMSLVGPRPVTRAELDRHYGPAARHYLAVRPGITGPWQVSGRSELGYAQRVALDVAYARNPSLRGDLRILLRTVGAVLGRRGAC